MMEIKSKTGSVLRVRCCTFTVWLETSRRLSAVHRSLWLTAASGPRVVFSIWVPAVFQVGALIQSLD